MVDAIRAMHECGYLHRDLKIDNIRVDSDNETVKLIDFGISAEWKDKEGNHVQRKENVQMKGTPIYASLNVHNGITYSRRDDMESLGYCILDLEMNAKLYWRVEFDSFPQTAKNAQAQL